MATTNTYNFDPALWEIIEEAYECIGIESPDITAEHIRSALRGLNLELHAKLGYIEPHVMIENSYTTAAMTQAQDFFTMPANTYDVINMQVRRDEVDTEVLRIARDDYKGQSRKDRAGRSSQYYLERRPGEIRIYPWLKPDAGDVFVIDYMRKPMDAGTVGNTLELPPHWHLAVSRTLAANLALKKAPERYSLLDREAKKARIAAKYGERGGAPIRLRMR